MPNHITTKIHVREIDENDYKLVDELLESLKSEESFFDFNKIIPQPSNIFRGNIGDKEKKECEKKGIPNWYDWNNENWGTKWNAYNTLRNYNDVCFQTAWCHPIKVITRLSDNNPKLEFEVIFADEDTGFGVGGYVMVHGNKTYEMSIEQGSEMARLIAIGINNLEKEEKK